jgi:hypothetical protein
MRASAKRLLNAVPALRAPLVLLRRMWRDRGAWGAIFADYVATRRETAFLRHAEVRPNGRTLAVFVLDDDMIYGVKQLAFISQGLRLRGWTVQVVLRNRAMLVGAAYFRAFGIEHFVYLDDMRLTATERAHCQVSAAQLLDQPLSLQLVKSWQFEGCWIGPQIISTLSRIRFEGMVDFSDPQVHLRLKEMLAPCLEHVLIARKLMQAYPANLALTIEANYAAFGPLVDMAIAQSTPVIQMIQPWKDDGIIFRRLTASTRREHPSSVAQDTLDHVALHPWTSTEEQALNQLFADRYGGRWFLQARNQQNTRSYTIDELATRFSLDRKKPVAVVFSQVLWDANLFYGDDIFEDYGQWFVETVRAACANTAMNWLVKIHPANVWKRSYENITREYAETALIRREIGELPPHVKLISADDDINTLSLFKVIDYGVTVRGTSGMELVCFGKHCVTAGTGRYSGLGFTLDCSSRQQYFDRLANLQNQPAMTPQEVLRAKWHAYTSFLLRPWQMLSAKAEFVYLKSGHHPLDHKLALTVSSLSELEDNGDLSAWATWAEGVQTDYLAPHTGTQEKALA